MEAQLTKLAVAASNQYDTNAKYVEVNSGRHPQIRVYSGMHALSPDEVNVYLSLVERCPSARVLVMHNHSTTEQVSNKSTSRAHLLDDCSDPGGW